MIVVIICSYNLDKKVTTKCLDSVLEQNYKNYKIIYIDDASETDNYKNVKNILKNVDNESIIIKNKKRMWPAYSRFKAISLCNDDDICFFLDGDDWLINKKTFKIITNLFEDKDIIASFGCENIKGAGRENKILSRKILSHKYNNMKKLPNRCGKLISSQFQHPRVVRANILKSAPKKYFLDKDKNWFKYCTDIALFQCVVDMSDNIEYKPRKGFVFLNYNYVNTNTNKKEGYMITQFDKEIIKVRFDYKKEIYNKKPLPVINNSKIIIFSNQNHLHL